MIIYKNQHLAFVFPLMVTFSFLFPEVKIFVALEQRNFSLLTYVNALNREIEALDKQNRQLKDLLLGDLKGDLKGYLKGYLGISLDTWDMCQLESNWLVFGFARSSMDGRQAELQEQLANQQEIEADSVNLNVRESEGLPCSCFFLRCKVSY